MVIGQLRVITLAAGGIALTMALLTLSTSTYYGYLVFYNLIYVIPLSLIVLVFTITLGSRKLQEAEGRRLKLLSGLMMLNLSLMRLLVPEFLNSVLGAVSVLAIAIAVAGLIIVVEQRKKHRQTCSRVQP